MRTKVHAVDIPAHCTSASRRGALEQKIPDFPVAGLSEGSGAPRGPRRAKFREFWAPGALRGAPGPENRRPSPGSAQNRTPGAVSNRYILWHTSRAGPGGFQYGEVLGNPGNFRAPGPLPRPLRPQPPAGGPRPPRGGPPWGSPLRRQREPVGGPGRPKIEIFASARVAEGIFAENSSSRGTLSVCRKNKFFLEMNFSREILLRHVCLGAPFCSG